MGNSLSPKRAEALAGAGRGEFADEVAPRPQGLCDMGGGRSHIQHQRCAIRDHLGQTGRDPACRRPVLHDAAGKAGFAVPILQMQTAMHAADQPAQFQPFGGAADGFIGDAKLPRHGLDSRAGTALFLKRWLRRPFAMGAVMPSGRLLTEAMARETVKALEGRPGHVVELGAGTGEVTKALLADEISRTAWPLVADGTIRPVMDQTFALAEAAAAHARMEAGEHIGKIVLEVAKDVGNG